MTKYVIEVTEYCVVEADNPNHAEVVVQYDGIPTKRRTIVKDIYTGEKLMDSTVEWK